MYVCAFQYSRHLFIFQFSYQIYNQIYPIYTILVFRFYFRESNKYFEMLECARNKSTRSVVISFSFLYLTSLHSGTIFQNSMLPTRINNGEKQKNSNF